MEHLPPLEIRQYRGEASNGSKPGARSLPFGAVNTYVACLILSFESATDASMKSSLHLS